MSRNLWPKNAHVDILPGIRAVLGPQTSPSDFAQYLLTAASSLLMLWIPLIRHYSLIGGNWPCKIVAGLKIKLWSANWCKSCFWRNDISRAQKRCLSETLTNELYFCWNFESQDFPFCNVFWVTIDITWFLPAGHWRHIKCQTHWISPTRSRKSDKWKWCEL